LAFDHRHHRAAQDSELSPRFERACTGCNPLDTWIISSGYHDDENN